MGLASLTLFRAYSPSAKSRATPTSTTTLPPSLGGQGGVFDVPKSKCPPDRGSSACVSGSPASRILSASDFTKNSKTSPPDYFPNHHHKSSIDYPPSPPLSDGDRGTTYFSTTASKPIPTSNNNNHNHSRFNPDNDASQLATPPLTPDDGSDDDERIVTKKPADALDFLLTVFPKDGLAALPHARSVNITAGNNGGGGTFEGVVLELPGQERTLYVDGKSAESVSLRESVVALLDLADESLACTALVIVLERASSSLGALLHSLMYVGGTVVTRPPFKVDGAYVLVGMDV